MSDLARFQKTFAGALLSPGDVHAPDAIDAIGDRTRRDLGFTVYRNNVFHSLTVALKETFPAVLRLVGDDFFNYAAHEYILAQPPTQAALRDFGRKFPQFLVQFEPSRHLAYLPDVAKVELAWLDAYHADDRDALDLSALASVPEDRLESVVFRLHPSVSLMSSKYPAHAIWRTNRDDDVVQPVNLEAGGEAIVIVRADGAVVTRAADTGEFAFLTAIERGAAFGAAAEAATAAASDVHMPALLANIFGGKLISGIDTDV